MEDTIRRRLIYSGCLLGLLNEVCQIFVKSTEGNGIEKVKSKFLRILTNECLSQRWCFSYKDPTVEDESTDVNIFLSVEAFYIVK